MRKLGANRFVPVLALSAQDAPDIAAVSGRARGDGGGLECLLVRNDLVLPLCRSVVHRCIGVNGAAAGKVDGAAAVSESQEQPFCRRAGASNSTLFHTVFS